METLTKGPVHLKIAGADVSIDAETLGRLWLADLMRKGGASPAAIMTPPAIGEVWAGQGGIYAGLSITDDGRACHLVLAQTEREHRLDWEAAKAWAGDLRTEGFDDWSLMTRYDGLTLFRNLNGEFSENWHWTSEQHAQGSDCAWVQDFAYGDQYGYRKGGEYRARAVRRLVIQ
jgi:hypothetical protein